MADQTMRVRRRKKRIGLPGGIAAGRQGSTPKNMGGLERLFWWGCLLVGMLTVAAWLPELFG